MMIFTDSSKVDCILIDIVHFDLAHRNKNVNCYMQFT